MLFPDDGVDGEAPGCSKPESPSDCCQAAPTIRVYSMGSKGEGSDSVDPSFFRPPASSAVEIPLRPAMIPQSDSVTKATRCHMEEPRGVEEK